MKRNVSEMLRLLKQHVDEGKLMKQQADEMAS
jgi:hypothetical protein